MKLAVMLSLLALFLVQGAFASMPDGTDSSFSEPQKHSRRVAWAGEDPLFKGFDGTEFYFHGHPNQAFTLLTETTHQVNAYFIPKDQKDTQANPGATYMGQIGITTLPSTQVLIKSMGYAWLEVIVGGKVVTAPETVVGSTSITLLKKYESVVNDEVPYTAIVHTPLFKFQVDASWGYKFNNGTMRPDVPADEASKNPDETPYLNFHATLLGPLPGGAGSLHGIIGQTFHWKSISDSEKAAQTTVIPGADLPTRPALGEEFQQYMTKHEDWYSVPDLFSTDCMVNRFGVAMATSAADSKTSAAATARKMLMYTPVHDIAYPIVAEVAMPKH